MRKQLIPLIITLLSLIGNNCFAQTFSGGSGTVGDPYRISNVNDLNDIAYYVNFNGWQWWIQTNFNGKYFVMTANITVNSFTPIGTGNTRNFQGNFNGGGYTLSSVNISSRTYVGLFGYISGATIENLNIGGGSNISSATNGYTGALIGYAVNSTINNCNSTVTPSGNDGCRLGGLIGYAEGCTINNCSNTSTSTVNSNNSNVGGLVGYAENTTFNSCFSTASMSGNNGSKIGGLIGYATNNCKINECYSTATFSNINGYIGGLIGHSIGSQINKSYSIPSMSRDGNNNRIGGLVGSANSTTINNCYSRASFSNMNGSGYTGGLIGYIENGSTISNSYSVPSGLGTITNSGHLYGRCTTNCFTNSYYLSGGNSQGYGAISKDAIDMQDLQFAILLNVSCQNNNWKHDNIPTLVNGGFPILYWQVGGSTLPPCFDGSGTEVDPFRIRYVKDLVMLSNNVAGGSTYSGQYLLVENNISFTTNPSRDSSQYFNPIGNRNYAFQGNFDGNGKVISNLTKDTNIQDVGLFGKVENNATIKNLGIEGANITLRSVTGSLNYHAAGLVAHIGDNSSGFCTISGCYVASSTIKGYGTKSTIAGLIGYAGRTKIENCYARANIIQGDYSSQNNNNDNFYGGLVGYINYSTLISNSYSSPLSFTSKTTKKGLLVGVFDVSNSFSNSYYNNKLYVSGMTMFGFPKDSSEMKSGCFVVSLNGSQPSIAWFKAKRQVNLGYPVLSWQKLSDNITPAGFEGNCLVTNDGSSTNPYQVKYVKDLIYISNMVANDTNYSSKYFQMLNDINYNNGVIDSSSLYNPIGDRANAKPFSGNFNGLRNAIANYSFSDTTKNNIGFFGYTRNATIQRLGISNINICAKDTVGGLVANADSTKIGGCFVYGFIKGKNSVGGLVGVVTGTTSAIDTSFTNTTIDALTNVGGLVGNHNGGAINNSYSNSEIYSSIAPNNYVGGIIGLAAAAPTLNKVYSVCKIIRNGTNDKFGKIIGNNIGINPNCYSRDSVFVNYTNANLTGYTAYSNDTLRSATFATSTLGIANWKADSDSINDGYPILKYQPAAVKPNSSGLWPTTTASQVVIIKSGVQIKANTTNFPKCAYVKIEAGGELNNTTNINVFGEYNRELYVGKWNLIGLSTYNRILSCLYNYTDSISFKTFVKRFNYTSNNWSTTTTQDINTQFNFGEGILVMPNYSLDARLIIKSRIVAKGVLFNDTTLSYTFNNTSTATNKFVSLANNYPASLNVTQNNPPISGNTAGLIQGNLVYVYDANNAVWINNINSSTPITKIKPSEGFFIAASSIGGNFLFDKSQISNTSGAKNTIKSDLIYVQAIADSNVRESFLEFNEEADNGFDFEDGLMLFGNNYNSVEPFFTIPTPEINDSTIQLIKDAFSSLPYTTELDLRSQKSNEVSLDFSNIPSNIHVYLLDSLLNKAQYLNEEPNYNLQVNEGDNAKRLYVLFSYNKEDKNAFFKPEMPQEIRIWNYNNTLNIEGKDLIRYEIYDVIGNKLLEEEVFNDDFQSQLSLNNGVYIVRAYSKTSTKTVKLTINN